MSFEKSQLGIPQLTIKSAKKLLKIIASRITSAGKQAIMLWGPPGIGKSDLVRELSIETKREFVDIRLSTIDPVDLRGLPQVDMSKALTKWLPPNFLPNRENSSGILFLDEINAAPPSVQAAAYQLILDRRLGDYEIPADWLVIAAGNRLSDRSVAYRIPTALANRFTHLEIVVSADEWYKWAWENEIDPYIIAFLRHHPNLLLDFDPNSQNVAFPTPRSWSFASEFQDVRDVDLALYMKGLHGTIGSAAAQQFLAFLRHREKLPDPEDILKGQDYKPPGSPDAQYVMMGSLINALLTNPTVNRISQFFEYTKKYADTSYADYAVVLIKELITAFETSEIRIDNKSLRQILAEHPSFKTWVSENIEVLN